MSLLCVLSISVLFVDRCSWCGLADGIVATAAASKPHHEQGTTRYREQATMQERNGLFIIIIWDDVWET